jgi:hypothetical protein
LNRSTADLTGTPWTAAASTILIALATVAARGFSTRTASRARSPQGEASWASRRSDDERVEVRLPAIWRRFG